MGVTLTPHQLIARLVAILPQPRRNLTHDHGVFAPAAKGRLAIVPGPPDPPKERVCLLPARVRLRRTRNTPWVPWADLLFRVFDVDALACPHCARQMRVHAVVQGRWAPRRVLGCLGRPSSPGLWRARGPPAAA